MSTQLIGPGTIAGYLLAAAVICLLPSKSVGADSDGVQAAGLSVAKEGNHFVLSWQGDETIAVLLPVKGGLLNQPITFRVEDRTISFAGFVASMNGKSKQGWRVISEKSSIEGNRVIIKQQLQHPDLAHPTQATFEIWMSPYDKAVRFQIALSGEQQHLDYLGVGEHSGEGLGCKRMYFGTCVINGPIQPFECGSPLSTNRYWAMELNNGLTELQGMDMVPTGFTCTPGDTRAIYDMHTYCSSPITYTFVMTTKGAQEAIREYSKRLHYQPTAALYKLPGRCIVMTGHRIKGDLESWYREFVGRGAREFIWLSYVNRADDADRRILDQSNSLYCVYTNYIDYFGPVADEGKRKSPDWAPENCMYDASGKLIRGYHSSTRLLPNLYLKWAKQGRMWKGFYNLTDYRDIMRVNAFYFDVHASIFPRHYYDIEGNHYSMRERMKYTAELFALARQYGGDAPIFSECGNEWYAEAMEGGAFNTIWGPEHWGIKASDWEYYPNLDQVHRRHHLPVGIGWHYSERLPHSYREKEWMNRKSAFQQRVALNVLFGRSLGTAGIRNIQFAGHNIHRPIVHYDNGATILVNRRDEDWIVDGHRLKETCYLIKGPKFLQYCEVPEGKDYCVEFVRSSDYWLFASPQMHDFGSAKVNGAYALRVPDPNRIIIYQIRPSPEVVALHLPDILHRSAPYKLAGVHTVFNLGRTTHVPEHGLSDFSVKDNYLIFEPDPDAWRYEIDIE